jgi:broad specificity phosphatase PhoE
MQLIDESEEEHWESVRDPRLQVWCSDHRTWREKCTEIHRDFTQRLERAREQFKDV